MLRDLKRRGLRAPVLVIGDGAPGFWRAVRDVWPETREQRCWVHRLAKMLDKLPKRLQAKALLMAFKLLDMAQKRWRRVNAPHLVALVREGVPFTGGTQIRNAA